MFESLAIQDAAKHAERQRAEANRLPLFARDAQDRAKRDDESLAFKDAREHRAKLSHGVYREFVSLV